MITSIILYIISYPNTNQATHCSRQRHNHSPHAIKTNNPHAALHVNAIPPPRRLQRRRNESFFLHGAVDKVALRKTTCVIKVRTLIVLPTVGVIQLGNTIF